MQIETIFCPQCNTLILDQPTCSHCGWKREPAPVEAAGGVAWRQEAGAKLCTDPALAGDLLLFGTEDGIVHAWDVDSGEERWTFELPEGWVPACGLAVGEDRVFVTADDLRPLGSHDKALLALSLADGHELWRYDTSALRLSPPLLYEGRVYFAASDKTFHAVNAQRGQRCWRVTISGWNRCAPAGAKGLIYFGTQATPGDAGHVLAMHADDGSEAWRVPCASTMLSPTVVGDDLYVASWDGTLHRLNAQTGERQWDLSIGTHILTPPVALGGLVFFGARDRHLYAVDREDGKTIWKFHTGGKVRVAPVASEGVLYVATSDRHERTGQVYALDAETGEPIWSQPMEVEDRVEHAPVSDGHRLYVATRHGLIWGLTIREPTRVLAPQTYEERGDLESAAIAYALQGDYPRAGQLYAQIGEPYKAAELFRKAGEEAPDDEARREYWQRAGEFYEEAAVWPKARAIYRDLGLPVKVANTYARQEQWAEAATWFEQGSAWTQAGEMYERAEQWNKAAQMYERAGDMEGVRRCIEKLGDRDRLAQLLVAQGMLEQAAAEYEAMGDLARAAELYREAGRLADAAALYKRIQAWDQARALYSQLGDQVEEAACCETLEEWEKAAPLYEAAARKLEAADQPDVARVAELYEQAARCYGKVFQRRQQAACLQKVVRYRRLPDLEIEVKQQERFVLGEKNVLLLTVNNVGFGIASAITVEARGDFEGELARSVPGLAAGDTEPLDFSVKPLEHGQALFEVEISYRDQWDTTHTKKARTYVRVEREPSATPTEFTPQYIVLQKGDVIMEGGQKGDRVDIRRGERMIRLETGMGSESPDRIEIKGRRRQLSLTGGSEPQAADSPEAPSLGQAPAEGPVCGQCSAPLDLSQPRCHNCGTRYCPNCHNPLGDLEGLRFCPYCRAEIAGDDSGEEAG